MKAENFEQILNVRLETIRASLVRKRAEYASDDDVLANFKRSAAFLQCTPEEAGWAFVTKHLISIGDMVGHDHPVSAWDEKLGDAINYLILIEAMVKERAVRDREVFNPFSPGAVTRGIVTNPKVAIV